MSNLLKIDINCTWIEVPLAKQGGQMVDVPTNATWALRLPGTTSAGKEKETDLELLCFNGASSRNRVFEKDCSTPSGFRNMGIIHSYHRNNSCDIAHSILHLIHQSRPHFTLL